MLDKQHFCEFVVIFDEKVFNEASLRLDASFQLNGEEAQDFLFVHGNKRGVFIIVVSHIGQIIN